MSDILEMIFVIICFYKISNISIIFYFIAAIEAEKGQQKFIAGIENFDTSKLKHTETQEKNPLPTKEGKTNCGCIHYIPNK